MTESRVGGYALRGVLGQGGQGVVHLAEDRSGRRVVVKILHAHMAGDEREQRRFVNEVRAIRRVAEFCTVRVLDVGVTDGRPYIVSEYVEAESLQDAVRRDGPRTGAALHRLAVGTAAALAAIHNARVVHRDFKPHNVLLASDGPRVIDFGIAHALESATTTTTGRVGTLAYMSPEQITGPEAGAPSDVFSWAGTMVFAATGHPPFGQGHPGAVMHGILDRAADLDGVPAAFRGLFGRCLAKDPAARPTAQELLGRLLDGDLARGADGADGADLGRLLHDAVARAQPPHPAAAATTPDRPAPAPPAPPEPSGPPPSPARMSRRAALAGLGGLVAVSAVLPQGEPVGARGAPPAFWKPLGGPVPASDTAVLTVSLLPVPGGQVLLTTHADGIGRLWEPVTGRHVRDLADRDSATPATREAARAMFVVTAGGASRVLSAYLDSPPRLWDVATGRRLRTPFVNSGNWTDGAWRGGEVLIGLTTLDGRPTAYFTPDRKSPAAPVTMVARDLMDGQTVQKAWPIPRAEYADIVDVEIAGPSLLLVHLDGDVIEPWDASSRRPVGGQVTTRAEGASPERFVLARVRGRLMLLCAYEDGTIRRWDTRDDRRWPPLTGHRTAVTALWAGPFAGRPAAISGDGDAVVRLWDLQTGAAWGDPLASGIGKVNSVVGGAVGGRPVLVAAGESGMLRQWAVDPRAR
ncbi:serine/threonine-protein kinase [Actinomadura sp. NEAU-AAG7]|uniref:serine/threonine-protein kinase n=1 Tax=Actinomadura sp. NEAU-AAG7 TaxID=2839640 RepID=UPI001BE3DBE5|nr:serine/threonine-protein kinase [Actinomadura sp. NEAU-AAG7]MBT2210513.1 protein kinase [Actinomadura sp. NEAU-AAG7]